MSERRDRRSDAMHPSSHQCECLYASDQKKRAQACTYACVGKEPKWEESIFTWGSMIKEERSGVSASVHDQRNGAQPCSCEPEA
eukprot:2051163-Pleurochrysis_carterae.AAC.1